METLEDIKTKARQKIEAETTDTDSYTGQIGMMLLSWIDYADNAAELILTDGKTIKGAFEAIRDYASKHKTDNYACVAPAKSMELVLEYFGQTDPQAVIEGGLMYKAMRDEVERWEPAGPNPWDDNAKVPPQKASEQKTQPVAEPPQKQVKNLHMSALDVAVALGNVKLEDLGL
jgi:hypothetical protein